MTGFDSKFDKFICMSSFFIISRKKILKFLNGENNYALAA